MRSPFFQIFLFTLFFSTPPVKAVTFVFEKDDFIYKYDEDAKKLKIKLTQKTTTGVKKIHKEIKHNVSMIWRHDYERHLSSAIFEGPDVKQGIKNLPHKLEPIDEEFRKGMVDRDGFTHYSRKVQYLLPCGRRYDGELGYFEKTETADGIVLQKGFYCLKSEEGLFATGDFLSTHSFSIEGVKRLRNSIHHLLPATEIEKHITTWCKKTEESTPVQMSTKLEVQTIYDEAKKCRRVVGPRDRCPGTLGAQGSWIKHRYCNYH